MSATTPVATTATTTTAAATAAVPADAKTTHRTQISKVVGIALSVSRVRMYVDKKNINGEVEHAVEELRAFGEKVAAGEKVEYASLSAETRALVDQAYAQIYAARKQHHDDLVARLTKSKKPEDAKKLKALPAFKTRTDSTEERMDLVAKLRHRFSSDSSIALASGLDFVIQKLVRAAMVNARAIGKAIIQVEHITAGDFNKLSVYPLVDNLKVVRDALAPAVVAVAPVAAAPVAGAPVVAAAPAEPEHVAEHLSNNFEFYVNNICKMVKAELVATDEKFSSVRVSKSIRAFCSDVVIQLIERLSPLIKLYSETAKVKTVNDDVVKFVFKLLMLDAGADSTEFVTFVDARLKAFHESRVKPAPTAK